MFSQCLPPSFSSIGHSLVHHIYNGTNSSVINIYMLTEDTIKLTINMYLSFKRIYAIKNIREQYVIGLIKFRISLLK